MTLATASAAPTRTMRALMLTGPRQARIVDQPVPTTAPGQCLVRVAYLGLCGTDAALYDGTSGYLRDGLKRYPFVVGHEWSGTVVEVAPDVRDLAPGDRVAGHNFRTCGTCGECRRGRRALCPRRCEAGVRGDAPGVGSEYVNVPAATLAPLPDGVDLRSAALLEPASTALHAVSRVAVREDDTVAVLGTGTLGLVAVQLAGAVGARVDAIGVDPAGLARARELGATRALRPEEADPDRYTVVVEASGAAEAVARVPELVAYGGRVALVGVPHHDVPAFPSAQLVLKDVVVHGVLSGIDQWDRLVGLVARGRLDLAALIDRVLPLAAAAEAFDALGLAGRERPKVLMSVAGDERWSAADATRDGGV